MNPLRDFRPDLAAFDTEWLEPIVEQGFTLRPFRITTLRFADGPVRTYGVVGFPPGRGPFPAILHIHGGCQSVCPDTVVRQLRRGYAAMSFEWGSWSGPEPFTRYPASVDIRSEPPAVCARDGAARTYPFLAACAARCCLKLLASLDEVDADRIGLFGVSWGGFITWLVNGTDATPRCAVPIYGTGGLFAPGHFWNAEWAGLPEAARRDWMRWVEPAAYAGTQHSPVFHINCTNDFFGGFDTAAQLLPSIPTDWRCDYTPNVNHGFDAGSTRTMEAWFDHHLRGGPAVPSAPPVRAARIAAASVRVETEGDPERLTLWASHGPAPHAHRSWAAYPGWVRGAGAGLTQEIAAGGEVWLYVRFQDPETGITVSSTPLCLGMPDAKAAPDPVLFDGRKRDGWGYQMSIMPQSPASIHQAVILDEDGLTLRPEYAGWPSLVFFGMGRPESRPARDSSALLLDLEGLARLELRFGDLTWGYDCAVEDPADGTLKLTADRFRDGGGGTLSSFARQGYLVVGLKARPGCAGRIRRMAWDER